MVRQLIYKSVSRKVRADDELATILVASRRNNALDGVTGLLVTNGLRFLQVLEGSDDAIAEVFGRIEADDRHHSVEVMRDRSVDVPAFPGWAMALASDEDERLARALERADAELRAIVQEFAQEIAS